jgi:hypothetical protein
MARCKAFIPIIMLATVISGWAHGGLAAQATAPAQSAAPARSITLPSDTSILGRLQTNVDTAKAQTGDPVDVQVLEDAKSGHDVLVKKGSTLNGHVTSVQQGSDCVIGILFDRVTLKNGDQLALNLTIQALAPEADAKSDTLMTGRGMQQNAADAGVAGHTSAGSWSVDGLNHKSMGVYGMSGVSLAIQIANGKNISLVNSKSGNIRLKKSMQLVMRSAGA